MDISIPSLLTFPVFAKFGILDIIGLFLTLLVWGLAIFIMIHYNGDWHSFMWYLINTLVVGIGLAFFIIPGLVLWLIWDGDQGGFQHSSAGS
ncbi:hypothetical protein [Thermococcus sp. JCM 11816]|uniref:hypothetical protein n=1 Tax=Thermococcus sp. (strain JCM 11816 / KS-1) TaxID=1295125 RepID=UPI0006D2C748